DGGQTIDDISRLNEATVAAVIQPTTVAALVAAVQDARSEGRNLSISGVRHSQGAHTFVEGGTVIDMTDYNQILAVDTANKTIRVQAGASWDDIQRAINPHGLAVITMQSSNVFTVGGSISANVHGRDPSASVIIDTVLFMKVLKPDGRIVTVSRKENPALFRLVVGGYGLFGIILEATLQLTDNAVLAKTAAMMDYSEFPAYFEANIRNGDVKLFIARPSIAPSSLMRETVVTTWATTDAVPEGDITTLGEEKNVKRDKLVFGDSRRSSGGKERRWSLQKALIAKPGKVELVTRNNAMRPPTTPLEFLDYDSPDDTDIVQEYYIPVGQFVAFSDAVRNVVETQDVNLLGVTIRFVEANPYAFLSYAMEDSFSFMLYTNQGRDAAGRAAAEKMTHALVDAAHAVGGKHYLAYQRWPTMAQVRTSYPYIDQFFDEKTKRDPDGVFVSGFYRHYARQR
ncbi:MAG: decaprenylphospho-beta-D-ribofuranose 2-oxidase, partial [Myxococcota bacterium]